MTTNVNSSKEVRWGCKKLPRFVGLSSTEFYT
jgi:hypothetical protein